MRKPVPVNAADFGRGFSAQDQLDNVNWALSLLYIYIKNTWTVFSLYYSSLVLYNIKHVLCCLFYGNLSISVCDAFIYYHTENLIGIRHLVIEFHIFRRNGGTNVHVYK